MKDRVAIARAGVQVFLASLYLGCLVWQAPHTVHHFFEHDDEKPSECALNAASDRSVGTAAAPVIVMPVAAVAPATECAARPVVPQLVVTLPAPRAPPRRSA
jgi:hypothetical protein